MTTASENLRADDRGGARRRARGRRRLRRPGVLPAEPAQRRRSDTARRLADAARGRAKIVALLVDPDDALLDEVIAARRRPTIIQLHGNETPERVAEIRARWQRAGDEGDQGRDRGRCRARRSPIADSADLILFDAKAPPTAPTRCPAATASPSTGSALRASRTGSPSCCPAGSRPTTSPRPSA